MNPSKTSRLAGLLPVRMLKKYYGHITNNLDGEIAEAKYKMTTTPEWSNLLHQENRFINSIDRIGEKERRLHEKVTDSNNRLSAARVRFRA